MKLIFLLVLSASAALSTAEPLVPCRKLEIAFVYSSKGAWTDATYKRSIAKKNMPVCSDSSLVRVKDGKHSTGDQLVLKDLLGTAMLRFYCPDLQDCKDPIDLKAIREKVEDSLKGKSLSESIAIFFSRIRSQTSTILPIRGVVRPNGTNDGIGVRMQNAVVSAGEPLKASAIFPDGAPKDGISLDLCLNAEKRDCGKSLPQPKVYRPEAADLPFGTLTPGLHVVYETKTLFDDTVPVRTANRAFVLAAHPSWTPSMLEAVRSRLALALMDPEAASGALDQNLIQLGVELSRPAAGSKP